MLNTSLCHQWQRTEHRTDTHNIILSWIVNCHSNSSLISRRRDRWHLLFPIHGPFSFVFSPFHHWYNKFVHCQVLLRNRDCLLPSNEWNSVPVAVHKVFNTSRIVNSEDFIFDSTDICQHIHIHIRLIAGPKSPVSVVLSRSIEITYIYATTRPKLNFVMAPHEYLYLYL